MFQTKKKWIIVVNHLIIHFLLVLMDSIKIEIGVQTQLVYNFFLL